MACCSKHPQKFTIAISIISDLSFSNDWRTWFSWLQPWFKYDPKLQYSFIYLLNTNQLITLLNSDDTRIYELPLKAVVAKTKLLNSQVGQGLYAFFQL